MWVDIVERAIITVLHKIRSGKLHRFQENRGPIFTDSTFQGTRWYSEARCRQCLYAWLIHFVREWDVNGNSNDIPNRAPILSSCLTFNFNTPVPRSFHELPCRENNFPCTWWIVSFSSSPVVTANAHQSTLRELSATLWDDIPSCSVNLTFSSSSRLSSSSSLAALNRSLKLCGSLYPSSASSPDANSGLWCAPKTVATGTAVCPRTFRLAPWDDSARRRFGGGSTNPWPGPAYDLNAFVVKDEFPKLRGGDFAWPNTGGDPRTGDFARVKEVKGDEEDVNAANPDRFGTVVVEVEDPKKGRILFEDFGEVLEGAEVRGSLFDEKMFWPLAAANGGLVDA